MSYAEQLKAEYRAIYGRMIGTLLRTLFESEGMLSAEQKEYFRYVISGYENFLRSKGISINQILETEIRKKYISAYRNKPVTVNEPQLDALIRERVRITNAQIFFSVPDLKRDMTKIPKWHTLLSADDPAFIGRRTLDKIRTIGVDAIEQSIITGRPLPATERNVLKELNKLSEKNEIEVGTQTVKGIKMTTWERLDSPNDYYFRLRTRSGAMKWYNVSDYSELVARTTTREAGYAAVIQRSKDNSEPLVAFNFTPIDYKKINDPCYKINGMVFSTKRNYIASDGKIYPYLYDAVSPKYLVPHPNCKHNLGNVLDDEQVLAKLEIKSARNPDGMKPKMARAS